jgi:hypothetical protein
MKLLIGIGRNQRNPSDEKDKDYSDSNKDSGYGFYHARLNSLRHLIPFMESFHNFPFVLGNWPAMRESCRRAASTARANSKHFIFSILFLIQISVQHTFGFKHSRLPQRIPTGFHQSAQGCEATLGSP